MIDKSLYSESRLAEPEAEYDEDEQSFQQIDALQEGGINASDITKLKEAGFGTIGQLFQVAKKQLLSVKGISEAKLDKIMTAAQKVRVVLIFHRLFSSHLDQTGCPRLCNC